MEEFIGNLIVILILGIPTAFAYWHLIYRERESKNDDIAKKIQKYISFDEETRTLNVFEFHPLIYRVVTMDRYEILHTAYQPETYTLTSVRVSNVSFSDVSKNEAYKYISGSSKTDKYNLLYRGKSIYKIKLYSQDVRDKAKRAGLEKYMNSAGEIVVVGKARVSQEALKSALSGYYAQMQIEGLDAHPSYDKCKSILDFLTCAKGQPVPKEKMDPAQAAALKKTLVGLLVFFLVMGGIFVSLIPTMIEDEILRGLSGTYMELNPTYCNGQKYRLKFKRERGEEQTLVVNGSEYDVYVKKPTWSKVEISGWSLSRLPFSSPLTLKYKWVDKEAVATKLLDSEGNVLWSNLPEDRYYAAIEMMEAGQYYEAARIFETMIAYQDSAQMLEICQQEITALVANSLDGKYADAVALMEAGQYEDAIAAFEALDGYKDSAAQIEACNTAIMDGKYKDAVSLIETDVVQAYDSLIALDGYKESAEKAAEIYSAYKNAKLLQANVGDYVLFGTYEQDNDTSNGSEAVEWLVLDKDGNRLLVISKYVLDSQPYHTSNDDVTWKTCSLRKWLNQDFMDAAFSADEKAMIPTVSVDSTDSYGKHCSGTTNDQVFVLSIDEAKQYFANIAARKCKFTAYAGSSGDCYWLRTSTTSYSNQFSVRVETGIDDGSTTRGFVDYFFGVRPAIWIDLGTGE